MKKRIVLFTAFFCLTVITKTTAASVWWPKPLWGSCHSIVEQVSGNHSKLLLTFTAVVVNETTTSSAYNMALQHDFPVGSFYPGVNDSTKVYHATTGWKTFYFVGPTTGDYKVVDQYGVAYHPNATGHLNFPVYVDGYDIAHIYIRYNSSNFRVGTLTRK
ncbi:hypothetical protein [Niabella drilacis]|uniref:Uncharacterized protein n=1 Tax=Niabella drilacis (strain DSM 25811 / CCM 8410 / CCUG 62505 / LMG 26954 / E90) TaxID=1285928 RepID=A0A1G7B374_NIADE|nr:hypothetical protein [Niabella drilacis]SDE21558.1 hypothetical protein SAMN04487894_1272 [Niabella drilacis]